MSLTGHVRVDLVVVGAGAAGMTAAIVAANAGVPTLVLEKSIRRGCNSELSGGLVQAAGTSHQAAAGVVDCSELMAEDILRKNSGQSRQDLVELVASRSADVISFLEVVIGLEMFLDEVRQIGHSVRRMHGTAGRTGKEIVDAIRRFISRHEAIDLVDEAEVTAAERLRDGAFQVTVRRADGSLDHIVTSQLVLATDGFGANPDWVRKYCPDIAEAIYIGSENNTGSGIEIGVALGGVPTLLTAYQGHSHVNPKHGTRLGGSLPALGSILVNREGRRFAREDQGYSEFARLIREQPDGVAIEVFDDLVYERAMSDGAFRQAVEAGAVERFETVSALASAFGLDSTVLAAEIERFNEAVGRTDHLGRSDDRHHLTEPLYGSLVTAALVHTQGGLRINNECSVVSEDGSEVPGLFAVGGTAEGISGAGPGGYLSGNGLIHAFVTGLIAGETIGERAAGRAPASCVVQEGTRLT